MDKALLPLARVPTKILYETQQSCMFKYITSAQVTKYCVTATLTVNSNRTRFYIVNASVTVAIRSQM